MQFQIIGGGIIKHTASDSSENCRQNAAPAETGTEKILHQPPDIRQSIQENISLLDQKHNAAAEKPTPDDKSNTAATVNQRPCTNTAQSCAAKQPDSPYFAQKDMVLDDTDDKIAHVILKDDENQNTAGSDEHTFISGLGIIDHNHIFFSQVHLKRTCILLGISMLLYFSLSYAIPFLISFFLDFPGKSGQKVYASIISNPVSYQILTIVMQTAILLIPYLIYKKCMRLPFSVCTGRQKIEKKLGAALIAGGFGLACVASQLGNLLSNWIAALTGHSIMPAELVIPSEPVALLLYFTSIAVLPAILEEFVFRGIVLQSLKPHGEGFAIILSAVIFALSHGAFAQMASAFLFGLITGFVAIRTGSLKLTIAIHFINNASVFVFSAYTGELPEPLFALISGLFYSIVLISGLISLLWLSRRSENLFCFNQQYRYLNTKETSVLVCRNPALICAVIVSAGLALLRMFQ